ncbi:TPA: fatty acid synthase subunit beta domain-containing protein [Clostridium botulinum]|uniref:fatty acid synthase subunit beta domain-containing protein n=3 Tax=Clostridium botulinum TaxID=1491 RepID=UPI00046407DA|nr:fatty acid synthase subunit beta domain-containing protein [Clostridium botulinum]APR02298.1 hypothetical protein RSJ2_4094 [Clostridium botulinum]AUN01606.1 hypothetical protein RSJ19_01105 [Clostridium botulinum]MBN3359325.1 hypothetical protein [Clostridium botulinum]MBN3367154.1 hypothetical protein [Clostridium botulinum]MBN3376562.1 hypothetical protein [Clostridium botulinum]
MGLGIHTSFTFESFDSLNAKAQNLLKKVGENSKIKLDFSDGMSLDKMQQEVNKLQQEIIKASKQSSQTFIKTFDDVNKQFEQQIDKIKNNLKSIGSNVNVNSIKDDYGKIIGALAQYEDKAGNVITKNYEIGKSLNEINEKGKYIEKLKLKLVDDSDLKNQNKALSFLDEEKKKIEQLNKTTAKVKFDTDGNGNIQKATITYTDGMNRAVAETYKLKTATRDLENVIKRTMSFEKTGTTYSDNIAKSLRTLDQYQKAIDKLNEKNINLGGGQQSQQFVSNLKDAQTIIDKTKASGESMTKSLKTNLDILINKMNLENKTIKENNTEMKKKEKIMKEAPIAIQGYENKINKLKKTYKDLIKEADLKKLREEMAKLARSKEPEEYARQLKVIKNEFDKLESSVNSGGKKGNGGILASIGEAMTKFPIWIGATTAWMEAIHKVKDGIGFISNLDKAQTNIAMIADMNKKEVADLTGEYSKLAGQLHTTTLEMMGGQSTLPM